jgi:hypothetical protein
VGVYGWLARLSNLDEFSALTMVTNFATLIGTYNEGFSLIIEQVDMAHRNIFNSVFAVFAVFVYPAKSGLCFPRFHLRNNETHLLAVVACPLRW